MISVSLLHQGLPFHYRLLQDFDEGALDVSEPLENLEELLDDKIGERILLQQEFDRLVSRSQAGEEISPELMDKRQGH